MTRPLVLLVLSASALVVATTGMARGVEPFATWYYPFAWYALLGVAESAHALGTGRFHLLSGGAFAATLLAWSVPFWLSFELINLRMANWYYVFLPVGGVARWTGIVLSFATVLPAILVAERTLATLGVLRGARSSGFRVPSFLPSTLQAVALAMVCAALAWPRFLYPLVWGAFTLLLDPFVYRRSPERSLLGRLAVGRPGLPSRLLVGGLGIGVLWELLNARARGKWIYTVPGLEGLEVWEMPLPGFLGFPVLALDGWAAWQAVVLLGLAVDAPRDGGPGEPWRRPGRQGIVESGGAPRGHRAPTPPLRGPLTLSLAAALALLFSAAVLAGMERFTITSRTPRLESVAGAAAADLRAAGHDVFSLADASPEEVATRTPVGAAVAERWVQRARLVTLRGIGTVHAEALQAAGIGTVEALAGADPAALAGRLSHLETVTPARVRVWVRGAREAVGTPR